MSLDYLAYDLEKRHKQRFKDCSNDLMFALEKIDPQEILGIDYLDYAKYIENTFSDRVNSYDGFQLEHIKPLSRAITIEELKSFFHYTNTRAESKQRNNEKWNFFEFEYFYRALDQKRHYNKKRIFNYGDVPKSIIYDECRKNKNIIADFDYRFDHIFFGWLERVFRYQLLDDIQKEEFLEWRKKIFKLNINRLKSEHYYSWETFKREDFIQNYPDKDYWEEIIHTHILLKGRKLSPFTVQFHNEVITNPTRYLDLRKKLIEKEIIEESDFNDALIDFGYINN